MGAWPSERLSGEKREGAGRVMRREHTPPREHSPVVGDGSGVLWSACDLRDRFDRLRHAHRREDAAAGGL